MCINPPPMVPYAEHDWNNGSAAAGTTVTYYCIADITLNFTSTCEMESWTEIEDYCPPAGDCIEPPPYLEFSTTDWDNSTLTNGTVVTYQCLSHLGLRSAMPMTSTCRDGLWTELNFYCPPTIDECEVIENGDVFTPSLSEPCACAQSNGWPNQTYNEVRFNF